ncbi:pancreatic lipase-related protein 2-like isoform X2 [Phyllobates terribilis]|uniref:pancreatic lipase-related protein 2-like isoform X2 n=1 Tax=Phyllobates terribilis TaxID=111132 RepID=UPI003CCAD42E
MAGFVVPVLAALSVLTSEVCYDRLGCFTNDAPWAGTLQRPIGCLPWSPEKINTRFLLYTKDNVKTYQEVSAVNPGTISDSNFRPERKSRFVIHGFTDSGEKSWLTDLCQAVLQVEDVNCFCVDWSGGSQTLYTQAANNIRVVGAEVAYFTTTLLEIFNYSLSNIYIIGHSLGAHTAGEAGKRRPGIGRITALNDFVACNHMRSYHYYIESVLSPDGFIGFPSSSYHDFLAGAGFPCSSGGCARMGHDADKYRGVTAETQTFYLNTGDQENFSRWRYKVSVRTAGSSVVLGSFAVSVQGSNGKSPEYTIYRGLIRPDTTYSHFVDSEVDVGFISMATFVWRSDLPLIFQRMLGASVITVQFGADGTNTSLCDSGTVPDRTPQNLRPCAEPAPL